MYSPYFYNRHYVWNQTSKLTNLLLNLPEVASYQKLSLLNFSWYWEKQFFQDTTQKQPIYSFSGDNVYGRSTFRPTLSIQSYYATLNRLTDILSRREFLYRHFIGEKNSTSKIPDYLTATPFNPLIEDIKAAFLYKDPIVTSKETNRSLTPNSVFYAKTFFIKELQTLVNLLPTLSSNFFTKLNLTNVFKEGGNAELYKNPNRPLRKGVSSMLRLHATGAIALPVEIRLQILASSRDVIHSWSIPSAGVKIDCVPGYTSHKIMVFLLTGIY